MYALGLAVLGLVAVVPAHPAEDAGKEVYDNSCKNCHGPDGKGDPLADKFYQVTIPRLRSEYVQVKPDTELREIITSGRRKMEPVARGNGPSVSHSDAKLTSEEVDQVMAYVRTLKP